MKSRHIRVFTGIALFLFLIQSCTIEKRHYTGGFHVEWKSFARYQHPQPLQNDEEMIQASRKENHLEEASNPVSSHDEPLAVASDPLSVETNSDEEIIEASNSPSALPLLSINLKGRYPKWHLSSTNFAKSKENQDASYLAQKSKKKTNKGTISALLAIGAWVLNILAVVSISTGTADVALILLLALVAFIFALLAFITGVSALKNARKGKGRGGAILGVILSSLYLLLFLIGLLIGLGA